MGISNLFKKYAFADSVALTGDFKSVAVTSKSFVKDSNFCFTSPTVSVWNIDDMFNGCENAVFGGNLHITATDTVTSANRAFRNCIAAKLPSVDISESRITRCENMFENCYVAELCGASIPFASTAFSGMFRNAKNAAFTEISVVSGGQGHYGELFSGCESGIFSNLTLRDSPDVWSYDCNHMFYYCGRMDCEDLQLDGISPKLYDGTSMFHAAGLNGSQTFDNTVVHFLSLQKCGSMFEKSNFSFDDSFFVFHGNRTSYGGKTSTSTVTSVHSMFAGCSYCEDCAPVVVLGQPNGGDSADGMDEALNHRFRGHYASASLNSCITDFSNLYENSIFTTLDLRGISNNDEPSLMGLGGIQDFTGMCAGCSSLRRLKGYLPPNARSYSSMFNGCSSLEVDLDRSFLYQPPSWNDMDSLETAFAADEPLKSYTVSDISNMFRGCGRIYSTSEAVDLCGLFAKVSANAAVVDADDVWRVFGGAFPPTRIAPKNPIPGFSNVDYDLFEISARTGTVRWNSYADDLFETEGGEISKYGLHSEYAKAAFSGGFYRYGGRFVGYDSDKCFFILFRPQTDDGSGRVADFVADSIDFNAKLTPHGWQESFETDSSAATWNEFSFDRLYAGMVCDLGGKLIKYAYIGNYTRTSHERRRDERGNVYEVTTDYEMPVAYFDGMESSIVSL